MNQVEFSAFKSKVRTIITPNHKKWLEDLLTEVCKSIDITFELLVDLKTNMPFVLFNTTKKIRAELYLVQEPDDEKRKFMLVFEKDGRGNFVKLLDTHRPQIIQFIQCKIIELDPLHFLYILIRRKTNSLSEEDTLDSV